MSLQASGEQLGQAVLRSVKDGRYPEDEEVLSADLTSSALQNLEELLSDARQEVESSIRELSKLSAPDINGWIVQAKELQHDIKTSKDQSDEIVAGAKEGKELQDAKDDTTTKVNLLAEEVSFHKSLGESMDKIQEVAGTISSSQDAVVQDQVLDAICFIKKAEIDLGEFRERHNTIIGTVLAGRIQTLKDTISDTLTRQWNAVITVDESLSKCTILEGSNMKDVESIIRGLNSLDHLGEIVSSFGRSYAKTILVSRVQCTSKGSSASIEVSGNTIQLAEDPRSQKPKDLLDDLAAAIRFPLKLLPSSIAKPLGEIIIPAVTAQITSNYLPSTVPPDLGGLAEFKAVLEKTTEFETFLGQFSSRAAQPLLDWVTNAPNIWLLKRSASALDSIRQLLKQGLGSPRVVERVERQTISSDDTVFSAGENDNDDDWNAGWEDEAENHDNDVPQPMPNSSRNGPDSGGNEEDAWGFADDTIQQERREEPQPEKDGDEGDAWGWGEDDDDNDAAKQPEPKLQKATAAAKTNGETRKKASKPSVERVVTLKETYHITAVPEQILEIMIMVVEEGESLTRASAAQNPLAPAAEKLMALTESLLAMYRAVAPNYYGHDMNGNMYIYNDSLYMAEQLGSFLDQRQSQLGISNLHTAISTLQVFGKKSYSKEMESQRMVLRDLLDGAQGFMNCTEQPFAQQCDLAISSTIDRLKEVHHQWLSVLSRSALLQSMGSLLGTVTNKIILDIEDMSDISEPESQRLAALCNRLSELDSLFTPDAPPNSTSAQPQIPLTAGYTPSWLKVQYLANILESSLVDIKYLWTEGELSLEFSAEEVVDLIEALFADSDHRRRAIAEIKGRPTSR